MLGNARRIRGIYFIDPEDREFKGIMKKMLVESWKFRCQQQCLVKFHCVELAGKPAALFWRTQDKIRLYF